MEPGIVGVFQRPLESHTPGFPHPALYLAPSQQEHSTNVPNIPLSNFVNIFTSDIYDKDANI